MVSKATQWRLAQVLSGISTHQRDLTALRISLTEQRPFSTYEAFRLLDRRGTGFVDSRDLLQFMLRNHMRCSAFEAHLILRRFDSDKDGRMTYQDFVEGLGGGSQGSKGQEEYVLVRVLTFEKDCLLTHQQAVKSLTSAVDFSLRNAFRCLDRGDKGYLTPADLTTFLSTHLTPHTNEDIRLLSKWLDHDRDGKVDFADFLDALMVIEDMEMNSLPSDSIQFSQSTRQKDRFSLTSTRPSLSQSSPPNPVLPSVSAPVFTFTDFLNLQLDAVRSLEEHKQTLILQSDFHPMSLFRVFDVHRHGYLTSVDVCEGLGEMGLRVTPDDCYQLLKLYDVSQKGKLTPEEFYAMFRPHSSNYLIMLSNRRTDNSHFSYETVQAITTLFDRYFSLTKLTTTAQTRLEASVRVGVSQVFEHLEGGKAGFFTEADMRAAMGEAGLSATPEEMRTFMRFYDRRRTGLVRFNQLCETLAPEHPPRVR